MTQTSPTLLAQKPLEKSPLAPATPAPTLSSPNIITVEKEALGVVDKPDTSKHHTASLNKPQPASEKGKEKALPMAYIDIISTSESMESEESILER